jgi:hypothetical protein
MGVYVVRIIIARGLSIYFDLIRYGYSSRAQIVDVGLTDPSYCVVYSNLQGKRWLMWLICGYNKG